MPTVGLIVVMLMGTTFANGGIIVGGLTSDQNQPCTEIEKVDSGIIVGGYTGIIVGGFTGIIVGGFTGIIVGGLVDESPEKCR